jgi:type IV secretion system protein VirD4
MTGSMRLCYLAFCLAIACIVWMLGYGLALQFFYKDGRIIQTMITTNPFAPFQQLMLYADSPVLQTIALGAIVPAVAVAGIIAYAGVRPNSNPLGDARFQNAMSLRRSNWFCRKGHILGRFGRQILRVNDERHHLVIGPTRSGKGACYVVPNALIHEGSMIVTDLKGEIFRSTAAYRKSRGNQVFLFAPGSDRTHRYNPLDFIRSDRGDRTTDIQNIAGILVPENTESENSIWQATAQQVMAGAISYISESVFYEGRRNLGEVTSFFNSGANLQALMAFIKEKEPYLSRFTLESFNAYIALSERAAASALLDIQKALRPFRNERVVAATSVTDMDLRALKHRPISIYLAPNITDITLLKPLLALFVQQTLDMLMLEHRPRSVPVYFLLDEFRQLKKMSEITSKLPYVAGSNIKMAFIIQDLKNLDEIYGETARHSLMGNCGYQLVLGANDQVTAETVSKGLGKRTVRYKTESRTIELMGLHRRTKVEQLRERDLMMPQEIRQMPADKMIIMVEGQGPILADKLRFFATAPFARLEALSRAHVPDIPAIEFLPHAPAPATTEAYARVGAENEPELPAAGDLHRNIYSTPGPVGGEDAAVRAAAGVAQDGPRAKAIEARISSRSSSASQLAKPTRPPNGKDCSAFSNLDRPSGAAIAARFVPAARKLKRLVGKKAQASRTKEAASHDWSTIFNETVPDEEEPERAMDDPQS